MPAYKALIFDLGKVIFDFSYEKMFHQWAKTSGKDKKEIEKLFEQGEVFEKLERDEISPDEFRKYISTQLNYEFSKKDFENGWNNIYLELYPGIKDLLISLKKNYRIVALTNTNKIHSERWKIKFSEPLKHFEKVFSSHEIRARKPEPKAYKTVLAYLNMKPNEVVFLDDNEDNIKGAERAGIKSILVSSQAKMKVDINLLRAF